VTGKTASRKDETILKGKKLKGIQKAACSERENGRCGGVEPKRPSTPGFKGKPSKKKKGNHRIQSRKGGYDTKPGGRTPGGMLSCWENQALVGEKKTNLLTTKRSLGRFALRSLISEGSEEGGGGKSSKERPRGGLRYGGRTRKGRGVPRYSGKGLHRTWNQGKTLRKKVGSSKKNARKAHLSTNKRARENTGDVMRLEGGGGKERKGGVGVGGGSSDVSGERGRVDKQEGIGIRKWE